MEFVGQAYVRHAGGSSVEGSAAAIIITGQPMYYPLQSPKCTILCKCAIPCNLLNSNVISNMISLHCLVGGMVGYIIIQLLDVKFSPTVLT